MNRQQTIDTIKKLANKNMLEEITYRLELDREEPEPGEEPYDEYYAFDDIYNWVDGQENLFEKSFVENTRTIAIAIGWFVVVTEAELERTIVTSGKKYSFKFKGKKYKFDSRSMDD